MSNQKEFKGNVAKFVTIFLITVGIFFTSNNHSIHASSSYKYGSITVTAKNGTICGAPNKSA